MRPLPLVQRDARAATPKQLRHGRSVRVSDMERHSIAGASCELRTRRRQAAALLAPIAAHAQEAPSRVGHGRSAAAALAPPSDGIRNRGRARRSTVLLTLGADPLELLDHEPPGRAGPTTGFPTSVT